MKKIFNIGGNDIAFVSNAVTPFIYKAEFHKDFFADMIKLAKALQDADNLKKMNYDDLDHVDLTVLSQISWACAKSADQKIKPFKDWLLENPDFLMLEHGNEIAQMVIDGMASKKK